MSFGKPPIRHPASEVTISEDGDRIDVSHRLNPLDMDNDGRDTLKVVPGSVVKDRKGEVVYREMTVSAESLLGDGIRVEDVPRQDTTIEYGPDAIRPLEGASLAAAREAAELSPAELADAAMVPLALIEAAEAGRQLDRAHRQAIAAALGRPERVVFEATPAPPEGKRFARTFATPPQRSNLERSLAMAARSAAIKLRLLKVGRS